MLLDVAAQLRALTARVRNLRRHAPPTSFGRCHSFVLRLFLLVLSFLFLSSLERSLLQEGWERMGVAVRRWAAVRGEGQRPTAYESQRFPGSRGAKKGTQSEALGSQPRGTGRDGGPRVHAAASTATDRYSGCGRGFGVDLPWRRRATKAAETAPHLYSWISVST